MKARLEAGLPLDAGGNDESIPATGTRVTLGIQRLLRAPEKILGHIGKQTRFGLLTNDGARVAVPSPRGRWEEPSRIALLKAGLPLARLFSPEHGLSATAPDGAPIQHSLDEATGLPVESLYGDGFGPDPESLQNLEMVLVDLQDVGARFYTYLWTLTYLMEACAEAAIPVWILDRPNPLGGLPESVEGPLPDPEAPPSFLGRWPIPVRHSLTLGEMALLLREEMGLAVQLEVVAMRGWERGMLWPDTGLGFHAPSPGIPSFTSALLYPGLAFLEATNISEGRGTELAFRWMGARWMDGEGMARALNQAAPSGVRAHPHSLPLQEGADPTPGVVLEVTKPREVRPVALGLHLLSLFLTMCPDRFSWAPYPTAAHPGGGRHLLRLLAREDVVATLEGAPKIVDGDLVASWTRAPGWWNRAKPHLLYS